MKKYLLLLPLILVTKLSFAQPVGPISGPTRNDPNWSAYIQSCAMSTCYTQTFVTANTMRVLRSPVDNYGVLFKFGDQIAVKCDTNGRVAICAHQTTTATTGNPSSATAFYTAQDVNGAALIPNGPTASGFLPCSEVTTTNPMDIFKITPTPWLASTSIPTTRKGTCTTVNTGGYSGGTIVGRRANAPCSTQTQTADCGSGGVCSMTNRNQSVFISLASTSNLSVCSICKCDQ